MSLDSNLAVTLVTDNIDFADEAACHLSRFGIQIAPIDPADLDSIDLSTQVLFVDATNSVDWEKVLLRSSARGPLPPSLIFVESAESSQTPPVGIDALVDFESPNVGWSWIAARTTRLHRQARRNARSARSAREVEWGSWLRKATGVSTWLVDIETGCLQLSPDAARLLGRTTFEKDDFASLFAYVDPDDRSRLRQAISRVTDTGETATLQHRATSPSGEQRVYEHRIGLFAGEGAIAGVLWDVTEDSKAHDRLLALAHYDSLTGLSTRHSFLEQLAEIVHRGPESFSVLVLDLDRFKSVNDRYGHWIGDLVLREAAERVRAATRDSVHVPAVTHRHLRPILARLGGDEFAIALPKIGIEAAHGLALEISKAFETPLESLSNKGHLQVGVSIGVAGFPEHGHDPSQLLRSADLAMYEAKHEKNGKPQRYRGDVGAANLRHCQIADDLALAAERGEFQVHYQPRIQLKTGRIVSAEALIRWTHPELGPISPAEFIPIAEESGEVDAIGDWVLSSVCEELAAQSQRLDRPIMISVNVSPQTFDDQNLHQRISDTIRASGVDPARLEFEVTEGVAMRDMNSASRTLNILKSLGSQVALDDFGSGFSSMKALLDLPLDTVKLDMSIVDAIDSDEDACAVLRAMLSMGHSMGLHVVAEGVARESQLRILKRLRCDQVQGFLYSEPVPFSQLELLLDRDFRE